jgi:hypothetical protein
MQGNPLKDMNNFAARVFRYGQNLPFAIEHFGSRKEEINILTLMRRGRHGAERRRY